MPRYVIELISGNARRLENWLGGPLEIGPVGDPGAALVASIDAITDEEYQPIGERIASDGPLYHRGGAEAVAGHDPDAWHGPAAHQPPV